MFGAQNVNLDDLAKQQRAIHSLANSVVYLKPHQMSAYLEAIHGQGHCNGNEG